MNILRVVLGLAFVLVLAAVVTNFVGKSQEAARIEQKEVSAQKIALSEAYEATEGNIKLLDAYFSSEWVRADLTKQAKRIFAADGVTSDTAEKIADVLLADRNAVRETYQKAYTELAPSHMSVAALEAQIELFGPVDRLPFNLKVGKFGFAAEKLIQAGGTDDDVYNLLSSTFFNDELPLIDEMEKAFTRAGMTEDAFDRLDASVFDQVFAQIMQQNETTAARVGKLIKE